jgi:hypothetical protein
VTSVPLIPLTEKRQESSRRPLPSFGGAGVGWRGIGINFQLFLLIKLFYSDYFFLSTFSFPSLEGEGWVKKKLEEKFGSITIELFFNLPKSS